MKQAKWLELWREVTGDERITQVDVRRLKNSADKGAAEVAAYTAKDSEYMLSQEVLTYFTTPYGETNPDLQWPFHHGKQTFQDQTAQPISRKGHYRVCLDSHVSLGNGRVHRSRKTRTYPEEQERLAGQMIEEVDDDEQ